MEKRLTIEGMTCHNCVRHTTEELEQVEGVTAVTVDLATKSAQVTTDGSVTDEKLVEAVAEAGYSVTAIE